MKQAAIVLLLAFGPACLAAEDVKMNFRGTLRAPPPCTINDGGTVAVDFGQRVGVNKVDGVNYRQQVDYLISCDSPGARPWEMMLSLKGAATAFDRAAVQTDKTDLGIRLYQNDMPFALNTSFKIDPGNPPRLEAVPVAKPGAVLKEGAFVATATLQVDYQ
ncbi:fimbrial protein [Serratia ureilytica]|uniref:fimbrial protein n=1 Tax=Serratia ureilytica TaxID=300181 RepID=UPI0018D888A3|nr:fimbrial protein [Serratia ureilytica]MBH2883675.1 fimbrial protein [Serratia ureilytica]